MAHYESKHGNVHKSRPEMYMMFTDLSNFTRMLPEQYRYSVTADYDHLAATVQGLTIGVAVDERRPYDRIRIISADSPVDFCILLHFERADDESHTDFSIELDADLNFMMKTMVGGRLGEGLDRIVDALVDASNGIIPEGMPSDFKPENFR